MNVILSGPDLSVADPQITPRYTLRLTLPDPADHSEYRWIAADEIHHVYTDTKGPDDPEFAILHRAFELLDGHTLKTGPS